MTCKVQNILPDKEKLLLKKLPWLFGRRSDFNVSEDVKKTFWIPDGWSIFYRISLEYDNTFLEYDGTFLKYDGTFLECDGEFFECDGVF